LLLIVFTISALLVIAMVALRLVQDIFGFIFILINEKNLGKSRFPINQVNVKICDIGKDY